MDWRCVGCGCEYPGHPGACSSCFSETLVPLAQARRAQPWGSAGFAPAERTRRPPTTSLADLEREAAPSDLVQWAYTQVRAPWNAKMLLYGPSGGGKTTTATIMALGLAAVGVHVGYAAIEEPPGTETLVTRFRELREIMGLSSKLPLHFFDCQRLEELVEDLETWAGQCGPTRRLLVVDSVTTARIPSGWIDDLCRREDLGVIMVAHTNSRKTVLGGDEAVFACQVAIRVDGLSAEVTQKNRFANTVRSFLVRDDIPRPRATDSPMPIEMANVIPFPVST